MKYPFLKKFGINSQNEGTYPAFQSSERKEYITSISPIDGQNLAEVSLTRREEYDHIMKSLRSSALKWRKVPAPQRGEIIRKYGVLLRENKNDLGRLVSVEMGKSLQEGQGEVQEMIDICDFAVGLSRQLYGKTMASERSDHHLIERWHPLGVVGIISAFNFPVAVWSWNAMIALVCGNVTLWKPSEKVPLCALACLKLFQQVADESDIDYPLFGLITGGKEAGEWMASDERIDLLSATGSTRMGKEVAAVTGRRLGKTILELGGNNAIIITPSADLDQALTAAVFGAIGTAGQRCTTTRRLIIHHEIYDVFIEKLKHAYEQIKIGNPLNPDVHMGPLIDEDAVNQYLNALDQIKNQGGTFIIEGGIVKDAGSNFYVKPVIAEALPDADIVQTETFAPILYVMKYKTFEEALDIQNHVKQGLSSAIMTQHHQEAEKFISAEGSDCGIANINVGTSGAEIGGAFGGEKETGGGRESGSDSWKAYMRRQTITINYGEGVPLAQGIKFDLK